MNDEQSDDSSFPESESNNPFSSPTSLSGNEQSIAPYSRESSAMAVVLAIFLGLIGVVAVPIVFLVVCVATTVSTSEIVGEPAVFLGFGAALLVSGLLIYVLVLLIVRILRQRRRTPVPVDNEFLAKDSDDFT